MIYQINVKNQTQTPEDGRHESEYQTRPSHKNLTSKTAESGEIMVGRAVRVGKVEGLSGKEYTLHLEFAETSTNAGEELRTLLREKVITEKIGSMQKRAKALQSPDNGDRRTSA